MPFVMWTQVGPRNHVLDGGKISTREWTIWRVKKGGPGHVRRSIYSKRLSRGQNWYRADADWGV